MTDSSLKYFDADATMQPLITKIATGLDESLIEQLIHKSKQANIVEHTPKDSTERFASTEAFHKWQAKGREIHWLLGENDDLAGIIWYGKSAFPLDLDLPETPDQTFAIRIYDGYVGKGLARPFMTQSLRIYATQSEKLPVIWLETDILNEPAVAAYTKFGYEEVARDEKRVTMVLGTEAVKRISAA